MKPENKSHFPRSGSSPSRPGPEGNQRGPSPRAGAGRGPRDRSGSVPSFQTLLNFPPLTSAPGLKLREPQSQTPLTCLTEIRKWEMNRCSVTPIPAAVGLFLIPPRPEQTSICSASSRRIPQLPLVKLGVVLKVCFVQRADFRYGWFGRRNTGRVLLSFSPRKYLLITQGSLRTFSIFLLRSE